MSRWLKQFIFGFIYLSIIVAIGAGVYFSIIKPAATCEDNKQNQKETEIDCGGPCIPCDLKNIKDLSVVESSVFQVDDMASAVFKIENLNENYDSENFRYKISIFDINDSLVGMIENKSFIYSRDTKYLSGFNINIGSAKASRAEITFSELDWKLRDQWQKPNIEISKPVTTNDKGVFVISGNVKNPNNYLNSKVVITALIISKTGSQIGATGTEIDNLKAFETRAFRIFAKLDPTLEKEVNTEATLLFFDAER